MFGVSRARRVSCGLEWTRITPSDEALSVTMVQSLAVGLLKLLRSLRLPFTRVRPSGSSLSLLLGATRLVGRCWLSGGSGIALFVAVALKTYSCYGDGTGSGENTTRGKESVFIPIEINIS